MALGLHAVDDLSEPADSKARPWGSGFNLW